MECVIYREEDGTARRVDCERPAEAGRTVLKRLRELGGGEFGWVRLDSPSEREVAELTAELGMHPLAVEDAVHARQLPKGERYDDVLAVALRTLWYVEEESEVETGEVMVFLGPRFVMTVRHGPADPAAEAARRLAADPVMLSFGPAAVLHAVLDVVVDAYSDAASKVRTDLVRLERRVFSSTRDDLTEEIYSLKREVLEFRDAVRPLVPVVREFAAGPWPQWPQEALPYFRDVADHLHRTDTEIRSLDELLNSALDAHLARVGTWQNDDMRRISAWAAMLAIPTMVAGLYGMNFEHMPELGWEFGYPLVMGAMAASAGLLYRAFRRNGWL
ncbi:magnesium and cobalt transport protein CorA [Streptomyces sp. CNQ085]|uniref:magnesium and cobalt transport protein CorA n=1 Tax=Streptomyces sp. CNQ085 TaxID=2886944 RepID=UPI001F5129A2|nr:magnesium and cobalt transport protein CorA [Streptomyces sp. CNQ085]MCI0383093.1 magnesium and cobalt transport protein CorA [Streptomyces sp. CNQ085]